MPKKIIVLTGKMCAGKHTRLSKFLEGRRKQYMVFDLRDIKEMICASDLMDEILCKAIGNADKSVVLIDYPETKQQLDVILEKNIVPDMVIHLDITDEIARKRMEERLICAKCKETYSVLYKPPRKECVCDKCGGSLFKRNLDKETTEKKLRQYKYENYSILRRLSEEDVRIVKLKGDDSDIDEQFQKIMLQA